MSVTIGESPFVSSARPSDPAVVVQHEHAAREAVEEARKEVAEAVQEERIAVKVASDAFKRAGRARATVQEALALLNSRGDQLAPADRAALEEQIAAAMQQAETEEATAEQAEALVGQWQRWRDAMEQKLATAQDAANALLKSLGKEALYQYLPAVRDSFLRNGQRLIEMAKLLGTLKPLPPQKTATLDVRRIAVATGANPANGAKLLAQLLLENDDPAYRQTMAGNAREEAARMGAGLSDLLAGSPDGDVNLRRQLACVLLSSLSRGIGLLTPAESWPLVEAFAQGMRDEDPHGQLEAWLRDVLTEGPIDLTFAVELAATLHGQGKTRAANEVVRAVYHALAAGRARFVQLSANADALDARLAQHIPGFAQGVRPEELERELETYKYDHLDAYEARELGADTLGAMLNGAALALAFSQAGALPSNEHTNVLLEQSVFAIGLADRLLSRTESGQRLLGATLEMQAQDARTFLDAIPDATRVLGSFQAQRPDALAQAGLEPERFGASGVAFMRGIQGALSQFLVPHLITLRSSNHPEDALELLRHAVTRNPDIFGVSVQEAASLYPLYASLSNTSKPVELRKLLSVLQNVAAAGSHGNLGTGGAILRGLGVVLILAGAQASGHSQAKVAGELLRSFVRQLRLGAPGLSVLCCAFGPLNQTPGMIRLRGNLSASGAASGSTLSRAMDAFAATVGAMGAVGSAPSTAPIKPSDVGAPLPAAFCAMLPAASRPMLVEALVGSFLRGTESTRTPAVAANAKPRLHVA